MSSTPHIIIFDRMSLVNNNKLTLTKEIKTCKDLKTLFIEKLFKETDGFHEILIVFDRYIESSVKEGTRERRTSGEAARYIISDSTSIVGVPLKQLLSNLNTKQFTLLSISFQYFAIWEKILSLCMTQRVSNIIQKNYLSMIKKGDTLIKFQQRMCVNNPSADVVVVSPDTDVFLLLIHFYP